MPAPRRLVIGWILLVAWSILIGWWAINPLRESLSVRHADGTVLLDDQGEAVRVEVECGAPIARDIGTPAVDLPEGAVLERTPCERTQSQNQAMLWINGALIALTAAGMVVVTRRRQVDDPADRPV